MHEYDERRRFHPSETYKDWSRDKYVRSLSISLSLFVASIVGAIWIVLGSFDEGMIWRALVGAMLLVFAGRLLRRQVIYGFRAFATQPIRTDGIVTGRHEDHVGGEKAHYYFDVGRINFESGAIFPHIENGDEVTISFWEFTRSPHRVESLSITRRARGGGAR